MVWVYLLVSVRVSNKLVTQLREVPSNEKCVISTTGDVRFKIRTFSKKGRSAGFSESTEVLY